MTMHATIKMANLEAFESKQISRRSVLLLVTNIKFHTIRIKMVRYGCFSYCPILSSVILVTLLWIVSDSQASSETTSRNITNERFKQENRVGNKGNFCECGSKSSHDVKIVGGILSKQHCWPWVAAIVRISKTKSPKIVCGSSIISRKYLLTAAHCVEYMEQVGLDNFRVVLGTNDLSEGDSFEMEISSVAAHPRFDEKTLANDIGLVELESPVEFSQSILPICLTPQIGVPYLNKSAIVAGWGSTSFGGSTTTMQMQIMVDVISNTECQTHYINETSITSSMMCARRTNKDSCQGDSGGPLFLLKEDSSDTYIQIGIVSFGKGCADSKFPGIYTRLITPNPTTSPTPPTQGNSTCRCGTKSQKDTKIVGGTVSKQHAWPWVAAIVFKFNNTRQIFCGGSVIATKYLLTAAHCTAQMEKVGLNSYTAILGTNDLNENGALELKVASTTTHPKYDPKTLANDVALVELESRITFSQTVVPICITPQVGVPFINKSAIVAGWGDTTDGGLSINVLSNNACQARYKNTTNPELKDIAITRICAASLNKDSCQGDSGGPLFLLEKGSTDTYLQIGIVSTGEGCAIREFPGIYARLSRFIKWIQTVLVNEVFCV
ncbi:Transmembrane protease serine 9 [Orchesella cincta]|uniref:Transmembrane protease serine 9 n=1 Tax=Orchesella cincta TaxID=48709 RepID=A0A1D2N615_ORCCI|nr:Transmembrane protease serine 9 [Orchesella cincta]